jgi:hypothetical protein
VVTVDEIESLYYEITGEAKKLSDLEDIYTYYAFLDETLKIDSTDKASRLLYIGANYWIGGSAYDEKGLWIGDKKGHVREQTYDACGVRPVVTLVSGVQISDTNTRDGSSVDSAYILKY